MRGTWPASMPRDTGCRGRCGARADADADRGRAKTSAGSAYPATIAAVDGGGCPSGGGCHRRAPPVAECAFWIMDGHVGRIGAAGQPQSPKNMRSRQGDPGRVGGHADRNTPTAARPGRVSWPLGSRPAASGGPPDCRRRIHSAPNRLVSPSSSNTSAGPLPGATSLPPQSEDRAEPGCLVDRLPLPVSITAAMGFIRIVASLPPAHRRRHAGAGRRRPESDRSPAPAGPPRRGWSRPAGRTACGGGSAPGLRPRGLARGRWTVIEPLARGLQALKASILSQGQGPLQVVVLEGTGHAVDLGTARADRFRGVAPGHGHGRDFLDDRTGLRQRQREIP